MPFCFISIDAVIEDGQWKILEINRGLDSGLHGYKIATGTDIAKIVSKDWREMFGMGAVWSPAANEGFNGNFGAHPFETKNPESRSSPTPLETFLSPDNEKQEVIFFEQYGSGLLTNGQLQRDPLQATFSIGAHPLSRKNSYILNNTYSWSLHNTLEKVAALRAQGKDIIVADSNLGHLTAIHNKAFLAKMRDHIPGLAAIMPQQENFSFDKISTPEERTAVANAIRAAFEGQTHILFKEPSANLGRGLRVVPLDRLEAALEQLYTSNRHRTSKTFIVQQMLDSGPQTQAALIKAANAERTISAFFETAGKRMAFTFGSTNRVGEKFRWANPDTTPKRVVTRLIATYKDGKLLIHDGFHKFSVEAYSSNPTTDSVLTETSLNYQPKRIFAPLATSTLAEARAQLSDGLQKMFALLDTADPVQLARTSDGQETQLSADITQMLADFYPQTKEPLPGAEALLKRVI